MSIALQSALGQRHAEVINAAPSDKRRALVQVAMSALRAAHESADTPDREAMLCYLDLETLNDWLGENPEPVRLKQTRNADGASVLVRADAEPQTVESIVLGCARINLRAELARIAADALADIERGMSTGGERGAIAIYNAATGAALEVTRGRCPAHSGQRITAFNAACRIMGIEPARRTAILVACEPDAESLVSTESGK